MKTYKVEIPLVSMTTVLVEAENENAARKKAVASLTDDQYVNISGYIAVEELSE